MEHPLMMSVNVSVCMCVCMGADQPQVILRGHLPCFLDRVSH